MSNVDLTNQKDKSPESQAEQDRKAIEELCVIRDMKGNVIYKVEDDEFEKVLTDILSSGRYTKQFSLYGGKLKFVFNSISEKQRQLAYETLRLFIEGKRDKDGNLNLSDDEIHSYNAKISIASQLDRIEIQGNTTPLSSGTLNERIALLADMPEEQVRVLSQYLFIFTQITSRAFSPALAKNC